MKKSLIAIVLTCMAMLEIGCTTKTQKEYNFNGSKILYCEERNNFTKVNTEITKETKEDGTEIVYERSYGSDFISSYKFTLNGEEYSNEHNKVYNAMQNRMWLLYKKIDSVDAKSPEALKAKEVEKGLIELINK